MQLIKVSVYILGKGTECEETTETLLNLGSLAADYATSSSDEDDGKIMEHKGSAIQYSEYTFDFL